MLTYVDLNSWIRSNILLSFCYWNFKWIWLEGSTQFSHLIYCHAWAAVFASLWFMIIFGMDVAEEMSSDKVGFIAGNLPDPPSTSKCNPGSRDCKRMHKSPPSPRIYKSPHYPPPSPKIYKSPHNPPPSPKIYKSPRIPPPSPKIYKSPHNPPPSPKIYKSPYSPPPSPKIYKSPHYPPPSPKIYKSPYSPPHSPYHPPGPWNWEEAQQAQQALYLRLSMYEGGWFGVGGFKCWIIYIRSRSTMYYQFDWLMIELFLFLPFWWSIPNSDGIVPFLCWQWNVNLGKNWGYYLRKMLYINTSIFI